jgi:hypothetical protein
MPSSVVSSLSLFLDVICAIVGIQHQLGDCHRADSPLWNRKHFTLRGCVLVFGLSAYVRSGILPVHPRCGDLHSIASGLIALGSRPCA